MEHVKMLGDPATVVLGVCVEERWSEGIAISKADTLMMILVEM